MDEHGEFCVRGGIVDLFPAADAEPFRVEFIGDTIESIRRYDPATQRTIATHRQPPCHATARSARRISGAWTHGIDLRLPRRSQDHGGVRGRIRRRPNTRPAAAGAVRGQLIRMPRAARERSAAGRRSPWLGRDRRAPGIGGAAGATGGFGRGQAAMCAVPACGGVSGPARGLDCRHPAGAGARRHRAVRRGISWARRAHGRNAGGVRPLGDARRGR